MGDNYSRAYKEGQMFIGTKIRPETRELLSTALWGKNNYWPKLNPKLNMHR